MSTVRKQCCCFLEAKQSEHTNIIRIEIQRGDVNDNQLKSERKFLI